MSKRKKKKRNRGPAPLSPKEYVVTKARNLPIYESLISPNWEEAGVADILIARKHKNDHITCGLYLVDLLCAGVKDTLFAFNLLPDEYEELKEKHDFLGFSGCEYALAHKIIYGAVEFAEKYGIKPHKDFTTTQYLLEENGQEVDAGEIEFGKDGKPCVVTTFDETPTHLINQLDKTVGKGNYTVVYVDDSDFDIDEDNDVAIELDEDWEPEDEENKIELTDEALKKIIKNSPESLSVRNLVYEFRDKDDELRTYKISFEPLDTTGYFSKEEDLKELGELRDMSLKKPEKAIALLKEKIKRYPKNPVYYNHLANAYLSAKDYKASEQVVEYSYQRFPDYLFSKCNYASTLLEKNKVDKIPAVFENKFELEFLYPERTEFHITEFLSFYGLLCRYFIAIDDLRTANIYGDVLKDFEEIENSSKDAALSKLALLKNEGTLLRKLVNLFKPPERVGAAVKLT